MRLVSYDEHVDVLYDNVLVFIDAVDEDAYAIRARVDNETIVAMGYYTSERRALSVMRQLRNAYSMMDTDVFKFPTE